MLLIVYNAKPMRCHSPQCYHYLLRSYNFDGRFLSSLCFFFCFSLTELSVQRVGHVLRFDHGQVMKNLPNILKKTRLVKISCNTVGIRIVESRSNGKWSSFRMAFRNPKFCTFFKGLMNPSVSTFLKDVFHSLQSL